MKTEVLLFCGAISFSVAHYNLARRTFTDQGLLLVLSSVCLLFALYIGFSSNMEWWKVVGLVFLSALIGGALLISPFVRKGIDTNYRSSYLASLAYGIIGIGLYAWLFIAWLQR